MQYTVDTTYLYYIIWDRPIRLGTEVIESVGPFGSPQAAAGWYCETEATIHPDMLSSFKSCVTRCMHNPNNL